MTQLIDLFARHCADRKTLEELRRMVGDERTWHEAHDLFEGIRDKALQAERRKDERAECQYLFEEACAKTLYNFSDSDAPFDEDSPYWIVPNALSLARRLGIQESEVTKIVAA
jgi:hypothetical protein